MNVSLVHDNVNDVDFFMNIVNDDNDLITTTNENDIHYNINNTAIFSYGYYYS